MSKLSLEEATKIIDVALKKGHELGLNPLTVAVLDAGGHLKAFAKEDGGILRFEVAFGKAFGCLGMGRSSRALGDMGAERPLFMQSLIAASSGRLVPVPGGVLIVGDDGIEGAVGVSGDTSDNDEICAIAGIEAAGYKAG